MTDTLTTWLAGTIATLAKLDAPPAAETRIGALGLSSLATVTLQFQLQREWDIAVSLIDLARDRPIGELAADLAALGQKEGAA
ncbi:MAG: hypothetical protein JKP98_16130 [Rhodobacteraceae bacterium]|jgi:acyl carrier protein|nr:hypothetical protein [Paracoccaceae bacterium]MBL4558065.1 hypothetical protein [Paracoccaceae bacterium]HBG98944.1 hypothetical protein [Paracoccaceae bacterium]